MVLWCISLLKHGDEQSAVGRPRLVLQSAVDPTTLFSSWLKRAARPPPGRAHDVVKTSTHFFFPSRATLRADAGLRVCLNGRISRDCCASLLRPIFKALL